MAYYGSTSVNSNIELVRVVGKYIVYIPGPGPGNTKCDRISLRQGTRDISLQLE